MCSVLLDRTGLKLQLRIWIRELNVRDFGAETETILELNCRDSEQESERFWS